MREYLEECVKTNYYYFTSKGARELQMLIRSYVPDIEEKEFADNAKIWTSKIIEMVDPKIILCEGKHAFDRIKDLYSGTPVWNNEIGSFVTTDKNNRLVVGFKRMSSTILHKQNLIDFLLTEVKPRLNK